jgi:hypothetical protein
VPVSGQSARDVPFERLREALRAALPPDAWVSERRGTYYFDEDRAAAAEVAVQAPGDDFLVVVVAEREPRFRDLVLRAWGDFAREVWLVDLEARLITRVTKDGVRMVAGDGDHLKTPTLPGLRVAIADIFSSSSSPD